MSGPLGPSAPPARATGQAPIDRYLPDFDAFLRDYDDSAAKGEHPQGSAKGASSSSAAHEGDGGADLAEAIDRAHITRQLYVAHIVETLIAELRADPRRLEELAPVVIKALAVPFSALGPLASNVAAVTAVAPGVH